MFFDGDEEERLRSVVLIFELVLVGCDADEEDALGTEADGRWLVLPFLPGWSFIFEVELLLARDREFVEPPPAPALFGQDSGSLCEEPLFWLVLFDTAETERFAFEFRLSCAVDGAFGAAAPAVAVAVDREAALAVSSAFDSLNRLCLSVAAGPSKGLGSQSAQLCTSGTSCSS